MRRAAVIGVIAAVLAVVAPSATATPKGTFTPKTDNSPQAFVVGGWDETYSELTVTGAAANGFATSYTAEWTSDAVKMTPNSPTLVVGGSLTFAQVLAGTFGLNVQFRLRFNTGRWSPWQGFPSDASEVPMLTPVAAPAFQLPINLGKLFYRGCKGCKITVGVRVGAAHSGTVAFRETFSLRLQ